MIIERSASFKKSYKKRIAKDKRLVTRVSERIRIFQNNPLHPLLRNHALTGVRYGQRAFWITGDIRIIYYPINDNHVLFIDIGSHNQVY